MGSFSILNYCCKVNPDYVVLKLRQHKNINTLAGMVRYRWKLEANFRILPPISCVIKALTSTI